MIPTVGRIVHYRLTAQDVEAANAVRAERQGNSVAEGEVCPVLITRVWGDKPDSAFNGTLFLDGPDSTLWKTSIHIDGERCFWPPRV